MSQQAAPPPMDVQKYLTEKTAATQSAAPPMDVQKYLSEKTSSAAPKEESLGRRIVRSTLDTTLPVVGAVAGGLAATPETFGVATIPAGAAGYAAGKHLSRLLKHYILGDDAGAAGVENIAKQTAGDLGEGAAAEMGGQVTGKAIELAAPYVAPVVSAAGKKVGGVVKGIGDAAQGFAEKQMAKSVGAGAREFENPTVAKNIGRNALDNKIKGPYTSSEEALLKATKLKKDAGASMDDVYKVVDDKNGPSFSPLDTAVEVENKLAPTYRTPINKSETTQLENTIESILARGDHKIKLSDAQSLKGEIDQVAYPKGKKPIDPTPKQQMAADASAIIRDHIDAAAQSGVEHIGSEDLVNKLSAARKSYGVNRQTEKLLTKQVGKEGAGVGKKIDFTLDPIKFGASVARKYGPDASALKAITADKIGAILKNTPEYFGKFVDILKTAEAQGPQRLAAVHDYLERSNPEYRQVLDRASDGRDDQPKKGPEKWVNDGIAKIKSHDQSALGDSELQNLKKTKSGRDLLIKASDLKPGSKAMDGVLKEIRTSQAQGGK